jgi:hypothetical protein
MSVCLFTGVSYPTVRRPKECCYFSVECFLKMGRDFILFRINILQRLIYMKHKRNIEIFSESFFRGTVNKKHNVRI